MGSSIINLIREQYPNKGDFHLMIDEPSRLFTSFNLQEGDRVCIHVECSKNLHRDISRLRDMGVSPGVAMSPATPLSTLDYILEDIDRVLPPPPPNMPKDPAIEHIDAMAMKPFQAFPGQDHRAHITAHLNFMASNFVRNNPSITAALEKNIMEHISLMAQEQVQLEFAQEFQMLPQMQQAAVQNPQVQQQLQQISQKIEARKIIKKALKKHYYPATPDWLEMVVYRSRQVLRQASYAINSES